MYSRCLAMPHRLSIRQPSSHEGRTCHAQGRSRHQGLWPAYPGTIESKHGTSLRQILGPVILRYEILQRTTLDNVSRSYYVLQDGDRSPDSPFSKMSF